MAAYSSFRAVSLSASSSIDIMVAFHNAHTASSSEERKAFVHENILSLDSTV